VVFLSRWCTTAFSSNTAFVESGKSPDIYIRNISFFVCGLYIGSKKILVTEERFVELWEIGYAADSKTTRVSE